MAGTSNFSTSQPQPSNTMGLVGFLMTLLTCGVLAPVGLILSLISLRKPPRVFGILGTLLGLLGVGAYVVVIMTTMLVGQGVPYVQTGIIISQGVDRIKVYRAQNNGQIPDDIEGIKLVQDIKDAWGQPLRYERTGDTFKIRSAGADKQFDTKDDMLSQDFEGDAELELDVGTGIDGDMDGPVMIPEDGSGPVVIPPAEEAPKEE